MKILNLILSCLFGADLEMPWALALALAGFFGLSRIFAKCGAAPWKAFVPWVRPCELGRCAGREKEGRTMAVLSMAVIALNIVVTMVPMNQTSEIMVALVAVIIPIAEFIYSVRVYAGLCEVFDQKKYWVILFALPGLRVIPCLLWGLSPKYKPLWTVDELQSEAANFFSNSRAEVLDQGLTVNLEERTVTEMFEKKYLLRDIHMYIKPGHMVLLLGGSGAGKTTFLNAVNGYEKAKAEVMLNGRNMYREYKDMMYDVGFVPQGDLMRGTDSVFRTLMDTATLRLPRNFTRAEREARVEEALKMVGLTAARNTLVSKLSGGQRKRLSIAMELIPNPTLFILDEPDSGLDGVIARELFQQLREIADQGKIVIVITHTPDRVIDVFDDVIVLAKDSARTGRLAFFGPVEEARTFFGRESMEEIVKSINTKEEGGEGRADEFILKYAEVQHG